LLEDISVANASGLIVNFTSGQDLTLNDIGQALGYLQEQIPPDAELIFGTTQNNRFQGRVQVNLIVTGLGASTFDDVFSSMAKDTQVPERVQERQTQTQRESVSVPEEVEEVSAEMVEVTRDPLDVPAFMRRRAYANISFGS
jgi:cell division protein FtsZ